MATPAGTVTTYSHTGGGYPLEVEDLVWTLDPIDTPLFGTFNGATQGSKFSASYANSIFGAPEMVDEVKHEWVEEDLLMPVSALSAGINNSTTSIPVTTGHGKRFQAGDIIRIDTELMRVASISTDTLTVDTRPYAGSAATHSNGAKVIILGSAQPEGNDAPAARSNDRSRAFNLNQIFGPTSVQVTGTKMAVRQFGVVNEFDKQKANRVAELQVQIEQATLYGQRVDDTTNGWRSMGGLTDANIGIKTNIDSSTTDITLPALRTQLQKCFDNGGRIDVAVLGATQKDKISQFDAAKIRVNQDDRIRGAIVDYIDTDFGRTYLLLDRFCLTSDLFLVQTELITPVTLRPFMYEPLAKTGDSEKGQILCEKSLKIRLQKRMARFNALT